MRKHLLFSVMLSLCAMGGMMVYPTPAIATVAQSPAIKVRGQVIDEQGEPLTRLLSELKEDKVEPLPMWTETSNWRLPETLSFR